jgi:hypothetical protein
MALRALLAPARDPDPATRRAAMRRAVYVSVFTPQPNTQPNNDGAEVRAEGVRVQHVGKREDLSVVVVVGCVRFRFRVCATIYGGNRSEAGGIVGVRGLFSQVQVQVGRKCARTEVCVEVEPRVHRVGGGRCIVEGAVRVVRVNRGGPRPGPVGLDLRRRVDNERSLVV